MGLQSQGPLLEENSSWSDCLWKLLTRFLLLSETNTAPLPCLLTHCQAPGSQQTDQGVHSEKLGQGSPVVLHRSSEVGCCSVVLSFFFPSGLFQPELTFNPLPRLSFCLHHFLLFPLLSTRDGIMLYMCILTK